MSWFVQGDELDAIKEIVEGSDRSAAILGGSFLELCLETALRSVFYDDLDIQKGMFNPSGPLGTFSVKNKLAFMLGMYGIDAWRDVDVIIKIRNDFAHKLSLRDFNDQSISARCKNLKLVERHCFPYGTISDSPVGMKMYEQDLDEQLSNPRRRYIMTIRLLSGILRPPIQSTQPIRLLKPRF